MKRFPVLAALLLGLSRLAAQEADTLAQSARADLQKALEELAEARRRVEAEKLPLVRSVNELEQKVLDQKAAYQKAERFQENQLVELNALKAQARNRGEEVKYLDSLLTEYGRAFRSRVHLIEEQRLQPAFNAFDAATASQELGEAQRLARRAEILRASLDRLRTVIGGDRFEAQALGPSSVLEKGRVALFGPVALFASEQSPAVGLLQQELNKSDPTVVPLAGALGEAGRALATTGTGSMAFDPTLGNAFKLEALKETLYEKLAQGGPVMVPLLGLGFAALVIAGVKWFQFSRIRLVREEELQRVLQHLTSNESEPALRLARGIPGLAGELLVTAVEHFDEKKEYLEEILYEKMLGARSKLERGLPFLALAATTGPLMGLLGTVTGMIATFKLISSFGSGDPKLLAAGISEALMATATGMAVAIPALLLHAFMSRQAKGILGSMEQTAVGFVNGVPERPALA
ncbi:MAG: MotA/TolQ/ExbB proton channel family protein [Verrucomicrobiota bacterium]